jgi:YHS domain-containing protein
MISQAALPSLLIGLGLRGILNQNSTTVGPWRGFRQDHPNKEGNMSAFVVRPVPRIIIGFLVLLLTVIIGCSSGDEAETQTSTTEQSTTPGKTVQQAKEAVASLANPEPGIDPVCGMAVDGSIVVNVDGKDYAFCSQACADKFKEDPDKYITPAKKSD